MSFLNTCVALIILIFLDIILTSLRPTWVEGGDIAHYVLLGVHVLTVILEGIVVFIMFSSTIWFAAGLLGQLFFSVAPTFPCWILRFVVCWLPWVYKRFIVDDENNGWSYGVYGFLVVLDILSCVALSVSLCYTMCCMTDKHMYVPYHTEIGQQERDQANAINTHGAVGDHHHNHHHAGVTFDAVTTMGGGHDGAFGGGMDGGAAGGGVRRSNNYGGGRVLSNDPSTNNPSLYGLSSPNANVGLDMMTMGSPSAGVRNDSIVRIPIGVDPSSFAATARGPNPMNHSASRSGHDASNSSNGGNSYATIGLPPLASGSRSAR